MRPLAFLAAFLVALLPAGSALPGTSGASAPKLRGDLAALVDGTLPLDSRISGLVAGYQAGELPFIAVLSEPNDAAHRAAIEALGVRVLRTYKSVDAFALAAQPTAVLSVAQLSFVSWLEPIQLVRVLNHKPVVDQTKGTPMDVGATTLWNQGITGAGVRVAVLDTGLDPSHPDLDDLDFKHWRVVPGPAKVFAVRNFVGSTCDPANTLDGHGHGTHVSGIATGTGEGAAVATDDGKYAGVAPGAELVVGKVMTDTGVGINSDLAAAMEAMALPEDVANCQFGADVVNMSLGTESRPGRLNTDGGVDELGQLFLSHILNTLAVRYGTVFVASAGNSGPFIGSVLETPGSAAQALSVGATSKDYDVNHDDTASGETCHGYMHPPSQNLFNDDCSGGVGNQPPSANSFASRGPSGDVWLRPNVGAPGANIVSAQAASGTTMAQADISPNTVNDPLYAAASGTSASAPATSGSVALLLDAYEQKHGGKPSGSSGVTGLTAPAYALVRAALMNTAFSGLFDSRWIITSPGIGSATGSGARNRTPDPFVGPFAAGAGKIDVVAATTALRDGVVVYTAASPGAVEPGTGHRDFQGSWQIGPIAAGAKRSQQFVIHVAPGAGKKKKRVSFSLEAGNPSDVSTAIPLAPQPGAWTVTLPAPANVANDTIVEVSIQVPSSAPAGFYTGALVARVQGGQTLRMPVFAAVELHDKSTAADNPPGAQARVTSATDVHARWDTTWPAVPSSPGTGPGADWIVYPVRLAAGLGQAVFTVYDSTAAANDTYDLYLYESDFDLLLSTHPFAGPGATDVTANSTRGPSTQAAPQTLTLNAPAAGVYYLAVNRARAGFFPSPSLSGDFGAFVLTLDEAA
jgi:subtilisin family serine protease